MMEVGAHVIPHFAKDNTDRNRTSPFAFTGNKFEFRMPGSSVSVAQANIVLNTVVAEALGQIYDRLKDVPADGIKEAAYSLMQELIGKHKRILFGGNGYTQEWVEEAERRGLYNLKSLPDAMPHFIDEENIDLFVRHGVFTRQEILSRYEILMENYAKAIHIESLTLQDMVRKDFTPALLSFMSDITDEVLSRREVLPAATCSYEISILDVLDGADEKIGSALSKLDADTKEAEGGTDVLKVAKYYEETILRDMEDLRAAVDEAEALIPESYLPYPTYEELLYSIR